MSETRPFTVSKVTDCDIILNLYQETTVTLMSEHKKGLTVEEACVI